MPIKNPLRYQLSEYDCGPTSLLNAMSLLFEREDIPCLIDHIGQAPVIVEGEREVLGDLAAVIALLKQTLLAVGESKAFVEAESRHAGKIRTKVSRTPLPSSADSSDG